VRAAHAAADAAGVTPSAGEEADDVSAGDLRFLALPAWAARLAAASAPPPTDPDARRRALLAAAGEWDAFLASVTRCGAVPRASPALASADADADPATSREATRAAKIARFRRRRELEAKRSDAAARAAAASRRGDDSDDADDARAAVLADLELAALDAAEGAAAAREEAAMLAHAATLPPPSSRPPPPGPDPAIAAALRGAAAALAASTVSGGLVGGSVLSRASRATARADVIRPGHTLPTVTIEEFADREVAAAVARSAAAAAAPADEGSREPEADGGPRLAAARAMDAWKDDHPYGYGDSKKRPTATGSK